jgi:hypothetical protein
VFGSVTVYTGIDSCQSSAADAMYFLILSTGGCEIPICLERKATSAGRAPQLLVKATEGKFTIFYCNV